MRFKPSSRLVTTAMLVLAAGVATLFGPSLPAARRHVAEQK